jgi:hypothetical protein
MTRGNSMLFAKFGRAEDDLVDGIKKMATFAKHNPSASDDGLLGATLIAATAASFALKHGQRFYLPDGKNVLAGKRIDEDAKEMIKLPFDTIAVLSETSWAADGSNTGIAGKTTWLISVAFELASELNRGAHVIPEAFSKGRPGFGLISCLLSDSQKRWIALPAVVFVHIPANGDGFHLETIINGFPSGRDAIPEMIDDAFVIANLCTMLSLENVRSELISPPASAAGKRERSGKVPLYAYHVLNVDGEQWDTLHGDGANENGVRSHLRRGHIRRLDGGARRVWVRATYVHGSTPGFVAKDYALK